MQDNILLTVITVLFTLNILLCVGTLVVQNLLHFWTRKPLTLGLMGAWQDIKYRRLYDSSSKTVNRMGHFILCDFIISAIIILVVAANDINPSLMGVVSFIAIPCGTALFIFGPRFVVDLIKNLKYNKNTGDLERIAELEKEVQLIKENNNV